MTDIPDEKPEWEKLRDEAARQYADDAKDEILVAKDAFYRPDFSPISPITIECAMWDSRTKEIISEWMRVEVENCDELYINISNVAFGVKKTCTWSGHLLVIMPNDKKKIIIHKLPEQDFISFML